MPREPVARCLTFFLIECQTECCSFIAAPVAIHMFKQIHVLLIDDHAVVREGYRRLLERALDIVVIGEASSAEDGYRVYSESPADVVVMDVSLPGLSGIEGTRKLVARFPSAKVLIFSMHEEALFAQRALQAGARGYITKSSAPEILVDAIKTLVAGKIYISKEIAEQLALRAIPGHSSPLEALSKREFEIFRFMAHGLDSIAIAERLSISAKTIANYQSAIRDKLNITSAAQLVRLAIESGVSGPGAKDVAQIATELTLSKDRPHRR